MRLLLSCLVFCLFNVNKNNVYATTKDEVAKNLTKLELMIKKENSKLKQKNEQEQNVQKAIKTTDFAIQQVEAVLQTLKKKHNYSLQQLKQMQKSLLKIQNLVSSCKNDADALVVEIYKESQYIKNTGNFLLGKDNSTRANIKIKYLNMILENKNKQLNNLNQSLAKLEKINSKLRVQLLEMESDLNNTLSYKQKLSKDKKDNNKTLKNLELQIAKERLKIGSLSQKQIVLNKLLQKLEFANNQTNSNHKINDNYESVGNNQQEEYNKPFLKRKLVRPFDGKIAVSFGKMQKGIKNNGVIFKNSSLDKKEVYSIAKGKIIYIGRLSGFGNLIILDHGDGYVSIYSGALPNVNVGDKIEKGQVIAKVFGNSNQPMGGVYFELRYLGRPINPNSFIH